MRVVDTVRCTQLSPGERGWAALAHLTAGLTLAAALYTGGVGAVVALLAPLGMYLYFGSRSRYVAFHALQATAFQALGGVVLVLVSLLAVALLVVIWALTAILTVLALGWLVWPLALALTALTVLGLLLLGGGLCVYPAWGAYCAQVGSPFAYPVVGGWTGRVLARS